MTAETKAELRERMKRARAAILDREDRSGRIWGKVLALPTTQSERTLLCYLDVRTEVQTRSVLPALSAMGYSLVVPYCFGDELRLFRYEGSEELIAGAFGILEPRENLRSLATKQIAPTTIDVAIVPGVAFDRAGNRLGFGRGYFDRLLVQLRPDALRIGLAYACQVVESVPAEPHDERLDLIVTEDELIRCPSRS